MRLMDCQSGSLERVTTFGVFFVRSSTMLKLNHKFSGRTSMRCRRRVRRPGIPGRRQHAQRRRDGRCLGRPVGIRLGFLLLGSALPRPTIPRFDVLPDDIRILPGIDPVLSEPRGSGNSPQSAVILDESGRQAEFHDQLLAKNVFHLILNAVK